MELTAKKIREMTQEERKEALDSLKDTLLKERSAVAMGGAPKSPGTIKSVRRQIARIMTVEGSEENKE